MARARLPVARFSFGPAAAATPARPLREDTPMTITRIDPGPRMSQAVVHGNTVYLAGQVSMNAKGGSIEAQTADILKEIDSLLAKAGTSKSNILATTIYLSDIKTFSEMNKAWEAWVDPNNTPARATVEAKLADAAWGVEIVVIAAL
jgi:enamine deaminase RidA (YjgF/YER057c/UK114 family)